MKAVQIRVDDYLTTAKTRGLAVHLSTYDVPRGGRAQFDKDEGMLRILFDYVDNEPPSKWDPLADHVELMVGKNSGKILGLAISVKKYNIQEVRVNVNEALEEADRALGKRILNLKRFNQSANYELVRSVLNNNRQLVASAAAF